MPRPSPNIPNHADPSLQGRASPPVIARPNPHCHCEARRAVAISPRIRETSAYDGSLSQDQLFATRKLRLTADGARCIMETVTAIRLRH